jgi:hypothetical protein
MHAFFPADQHGLRCVIVKCRGKEKIVSSRRAEATTAIESALVVAQFEPLPQLEELSPSQKKAISRFVSGSIRDWTCFSEYFSESLPFNPTSLRQP